IVMEMAEAFRSRGLEVTMLHQFDLPMEGLERETREYVLEELKRNDIQFIPNVKVEAFQKDPNGKVRYVITNRGSFEADIVLLSIGFVPNVELAQTARIRLGSFGGIVTDERQRTSIDHIYAAGDCCEVKNIATGKPMYLPLATVASRAAWVAGESAAGGKAIFKGAIRAVAVKLFDTEIAQVGLGSEEAKNYGFKVATTLIHAPSKVEIMAGSEKIHIHLIYDKISSRLFGANVYGKEGVMQRMNVLGAAIQQKLTLDEVSRLDMIYAPLFTPLWDPILIAANRAKKEFKL
ncbi:MAG: FAD-dependent oxidoreductase, partial [Ignavibacteriales bacterium]|nr:FAD-dependent oxidoreductase [Ignavibacteriales bacterium]